jgi:hypothetical protein
MARVTVKIPISVEVDERKIEAVRSLDRFAGKIARVRRALVDDDELSELAEGAAKAIRTLWPKR